MSRQLSSRLVVATHNAGKLREFAELLAPHFKTIVSSAELKLPEPEETGKTFTDNALLKARAAAKASGGPALADDSGLCVTALGGDPGIYSARWSGPDKDPMFAMTRVNRELGTAKDRSAHFVCVLALAWPDGHAEIFEGRVDGHLVWPPRGSEGHGYDPIFVPEGHEHTFAEMQAHVKHALSHRGIAVGRLIQGLTLMENGYVEVAAHKPPTKNRVAILQIILAVLGGLLFIGSRALRLWLWKSMPQTPEGPFNTAIFIHERTVFTDVFFINLHNILMWGGMALFLTAVAIEAVKKFSEAVKK